MLDYLIALSPKYDRNAIAMPHLLIWLYVAVKDSITLIAIATGFTSIGNLGFGLDNCLNGNCIGADN